MKMNRMINPARILRHFSHARLIQREDGKHELAGGNDVDYTEAKEWVSLFAHEIVLNLPINRRRRPNFALGPDR